MTQTIPSSPINTRARSNFAARYVEALFKSLLFRVSSCGAGSANRRNTSQHTKPTDTQPCDPISRNRILMLAKCRENDSTMAIADFYFIIVVVMQSETRSRHASWKSYVSALDFILLIFFFFLSCSFSTLRVAILYHSKIKVSIMVRGVSLLVCPSFFAWIFDGYSLRIVRGSTITFDDIYCT